MAKMTYSKGSNEEGVSSPKDEWDLDENPLEGEKNMATKVALFLV